MSILSSLLGSLREDSRGTAVLEETDWLRRAEENPSLPLVRRKAGDEAARRGERALAIRHWLAAADLYMGQGYAVKALAVLASVLGLDPENAEAPARIANIARDEELAAHRGPDLTIRTRLRAWTPLFSDFSRADLGQIVRGMTVRRFQAGDILLREGELADALCVVMEGSVGIVAVDSRGGATGIGRMHNGDFFGESGLLRGQSSRATLVAESPGELLCWPRGAFEAISAAKPHVRAILDRFREERANMAVDAAVERHHRSVFSPASR